MSICIAREPESNMNFPTHSMWENSCLTKKKMITHSFLLHTIIENQHWVIYHTSCFGGNNVFVREKAWIKGWFEHLPILLSKVEQQNWSKFWFVVWSVIFEEAEKMRFSRNWETQRNALQVFEAFVLLYASSLHVGNENISLFPT